MILIDANLLLYAYDETSQFHARSRAWLEKVFAGNEPIGLSWTTLLAFLRISTNQRIFLTPFSIEEASSIVAEWLAMPNVTIVQPGEAHWPILNHVLRTAGVRGPLVTDAHLAALAIEHGVVLYTSDGDFALFGDLRWRNPLEDGSEPLEVP